MTLIDREGAHVAALLHDPSLEEEPKLLEAVTAAAGIALENGRLHAELRARLDELRGSRARIVEAALQERQRLERNLHDGAQQRLVALSLELSLIEANLDEDPAAQGSARSGEARNRRLARRASRNRQGIHPAVVSGHGLAVALEQLAARASVPVRLTVEVDGRLPEPRGGGRRTTWSPRASRTSASTRRRIYGDDRRCPRRTVCSLVEVADDGIGGADTERGTGLRGLADRVEALGGRLRVWSPAGGGTRVRAEIPCA